jgi:hypothetical protein
MLMKLWALLGIRNGWQRRMRPTDVALANVQFCETGSSYPTAAEWRLRAEKVFADATWAERQFVRASRPISRVSHAATPLLTVPRVERAYRGLHTRVLVLRR